MSPHKFGNILKENPLLYICPYVLCIVSQANLLFSDVRKKQSEKKGTRNVNRDVKWDFQKPR